MQKALYELKQTPRGWFEKLRSILQLWKFTRAKSNNSLFYKRSDNDLILLLIYVNDIIVTGSNNVKIEKLIYNLRNTFTLNDLG